VVEEALCIFAMLSVRRRSSATSPDLVVIVRVTPFSTLATLRSAPSTFIGQFCIIDMPDFSGCGETGSFWVLATASIVNAVATATVNKIFLMLVLPPRWRECTRPTARHCVPRKPFGISQELLGLSLRLTDLFRQKQSRANSPNKNVVSPMNETICRAERLCWCRK